MGILKIFKSNGAAALINESEVSDRVKPIFEGAYSICREFGLEESFDNYMYKNKIIVLQHSNPGEGDPDAFSKGKHAEIWFKGQEVFNCSVSKEGLITLKRYDHGEWENYFQVLRKRVKTTLEARKICSDTYRLIDKLKSLNMVKCSKSPYFVPPKYKRIDLYEYTYSGCGMQIVFHTDGQRIASEAIISYKGKPVFNATHYYTDYRRPFSSNTRCNLFKRGEWESNFKVLMKCFCEQ